MFDHEYTTSFLVRQDPQAVFDVISNVRGLWSDAGERDVDDRRSSDATNAATDSTGRTAQ